MPEPGEIICAEEIYRSYLAALMPLSSVTSARGSMLSRSLLEHKSNEQQLAEQELCSICFEAVCYPTETLVCKHQFHINCLERARDQRTSDNRPVPLVCPNCRNPIQTRDVILFDLCRNQHFSGPSAEHLFEAYIRTNAITLYQLKRWTPALLEILVTDDTRSNILWWYLVDNLDCELNRSVLEFVKTYHSRWLTYEPADFKYIDMDFLEKMILHPKFHYDKDNTANQLIQLGREMGNTDLLKALAKRRTQYTILRRPV